MNRQSQISTEQSVRPTTLHTSGVLQRKCAACGNHTIAGGECQACSKTRQFGLQTKLKVSEPGDMYEQEADRIADQVLAASAYPTVNGAPSRIQRFAGQPTWQAAEAPASVNQALASPGSPLEPALKQDMEQRFGYDFSRVRVHSGAAAEQSALDVNANAYTMGHNIVFGAGRFAPLTNEGRLLLAHELTHVVQQINAPNLIQRLIRTPYPWEGVITPVIGANIRSSPDLSDPANIIDSIPQGQFVSVISSTGNWLRIESRYRGRLLVGYVHHRLVDDSTSHSMAASVGTTMVWRPSGPRPGTDFQSWASASTEIPFPVVTSSTVMNCWEAVLLSAYRAGAINWNWIHNLYVSTPERNWVSAMSRGPRRRYSVPGPNRRMPQRGDLVFFDGLAHVALATGSGSNVYTFWPPPDTPFSQEGGTTDRVKVFTIEELVMWWNANWQSQPVVEFAAPNW